MEYIFPAWHNLLSNWSFNRPQIEIYDGINRARVLQDNGRKVCLVFTDYQPQLMAKLTRANLAADRMISLFDYLQGIGDQSGTIFDYQDLKWPKDAIFDFTPFRLLVISKKSLYARLSFDTSSRVLYVEYFDQQGKLKRKLFIDSRGFISAKEENQKMTYYDPIGHWRLIHDKKTDQVIINPLFNYFKHEKYIHMRELLTEVLKKQVLAKLKNDDHLIITLDDQSSIPYSVYENKQPIYVLNKSYVYKNCLKQVKKGQLLVPSKVEAERVKQEIPNALRVTVMPTFPVGVHLGHSQRLRRQIIAIFAEHLDYQNLKKLIAILYKRLIRNPNELGLTILTYSVSQDNLAQKVLSELKKEHSNEYLTVEEAKKQKEDQIEKITEPIKLPVLYLTHHRLISIADTFKILDKVRILVNWQISDDFIQSAAISVGIPQLQNFASATLIDQGNGRIFHSLDQLNKDLSFYLNSLKNWNQALVFDVQLMNKFSEENLIKIWQKVFQAKKDV